MLPMEAQELLLGNSANVKHVVPFDPGMFNSGRKSVSSGGSSPVPSSSPRHFSLSAIDSSEFAVFSNYNSNFRSLSRESSIMEPLLIRPEAVRVERVTPPPVHFAVGEEITPGAYNTPINKLIRSENRLSRARCHSLGDSPLPLIPQTRLSLGMNNSYMRTLETCNCSSQTDLQSLDDFINSPSSSNIMYTHKEDGSNSDCSQGGRISPTASVASHTSEDLQAYVKEMTKEIAIEIKSEIREVISKVEDVLENSENIEISNRNNFCRNPNNVSSQSLDSNSVSISDVAEYLMGVSREMASEVKHEIREMVNQVDEMISPEINTTGVHFYLSSPNGSRKNSPPEMVRKRYRSGSESVIQRVKSTPPSSLDDLHVVKKTLKKSPTSPVILMSDKMLSSPIMETVDGEKESPVFFRALQSIGQTDCGTSPQHSPDSLPLDVPGTGSLSFNSSDTSSPDTIIQVLSSSITALPIPHPQSISTHKLSDDDNSCTESECQQLYCKNRVWYHNNSVSSQDSGINMSFVDHDQGCSEAG